jgi:hypothetical protein
MAEFVRLCDQAIDRARDLLEVARSSGDERRAALADRAITVLALERDAAVAGRIPGRSDGFGFGPTRFVSDNDWGPHGEDFVRAVYALQDHWARNT